MDWKDWARLVRIPTVFTVIADVSAAFLLTAGGPEPVSRWICIVLAGVSLYWAGMIFNDVFDVEKDRKERPTRPIPAGRISVRSASIAGGILVLIGVGFAILSGYLPGTLPGGDLELAATLRPATVAVLLVTMILLYDGPLKQTPLGPVAMGGCRVLSFLLGASPVLLGEQPESVFPTHIWAAAIGMGVYVMGVTLIARREASETSRGILGIGVAVLILGCLCMAIVPRLAEAGIPFRIRGNDGFALLIGMLGFTVVYRAVKLFSDPSPQRVQATVKIALLSLIAFASAFAMLGAGPIWGMAIFLLVFPATFLSARFRMT